MSISNYLDKLVELRGTIGSIMQTKGYNVSNTSTLNQISSAIANIEVYRTETAKLVNERYGTNFTGTESDWREIRSPKVDKTGKNAVNLNKLVGVVCDNNFYGIDLNADIETNVCITQFIDENDYEFLCDTNFSNVYLFDLHIRTFNDSGARYEVFNCKNLYIKNCTIDDSDILFYDNAFENVIYENNHHLTNSNMFYDAYIQHDFIYIADDNGDMPECMLDNVNIGGSLIIKNVSTISDERIIHDCTIQGSVIFEDPLMQNGDNDCIEGCRIGYLYMNIYSNDYENLVKDCIIDSFKLVISGNLSIYNVNECGSINYLYIENTNPSLFNVLDWGAFMDVHIKTVLLKGIFSTDNFDGDTFEESNIINRFDVDASGSYSLTNNQVLFSKDGKLYSCRRYNISSSSTYSSSTAISLECDPNRLKTIFIVPSNINRIREVNLSYAKYIKFEYLDILYTTDDYYATFHADVCLNMSNINQASSVRQHSNYSILTVFDSDKYLYLPKTIKWDMGNVIVFEEHNGVLNGWNTSFDIIENAYDYNNKLVNNLNSKIRLCGDNDGIILIPKGLNPTHTIEIRGNVKYVIFCSGATTDIYNTVTKNNIKCINQSNYPNLTVINNQNTPIIFDIGSLENPFNATQLRSEDGELIGYAYGSGSIMSYGASYDVVISPNTDTWTPNQFYNGSTNLRLVPTYLIINNRTVDNKFCHSSNLICLNNVKKYVGWQPAGKNYFNHGINEIQLISYTSDNADIEQGWANTDLWIPDTCQSLKIETDVASGVTLYIPYDVMCNNNDSIYIDNAKIIIYNSPEDPSDIHTFDSFDEQNTHTYNCTFSYWYL